MLEIVEVEGKRYQAIEDGSFYCHDDCAAIDKPFDNPLCKHLPCSSRFREDGKNVHFVEVE